MRRMMDKMGLDMQEMPNVREVLIRTDKKEIILSKPEVMSLPLFFSTEMKSSIFTSQKFAYCHIFTLPVYGISDVHLYSSLSHVSKNC